MTSDVKVFELKVRPARVVDLSFPVSGQIQFRSTGAKLGKKVSELSLDNCGLGDLQMTKNWGTGTPPPDFVKVGFWSRLQVDADYINNKLVRETRCLFSLENSTVKADLDKAIAVRQNAFLSRYGHVDRLTKLSDDAFGKGQAVTSLPGVTPIVVSAPTDGQRLTTLLAIRKNLILHKSVMAAEYASMPVIRSTITRTTPKGEVQVENHTVPLGNRSVADTAGTKTDTSNYPTWFNGSNWQDHNNTNPVFSSQSVTKYPGNSFTSVSETTLPQFVAPKVENEIQIDKQLLIIDDEIFKLQCEQVHGSYRDVILKNELALLDAEVRRLQKLYISTHILPTFDGVITSIYKDLGEFVHAGDPVLRIEDDSTLLLIARVQYRDLVRIGDLVTVTSADLFEAGKSVVLSAEVVRIHEHEKDDDVWQLLLSCSNPIDASGIASIPMNYNFDRKSVELKFV